MLLVAVLYHTYVILVTYVYLDLLTPLRTTFTAGRSYLTGQLDKLETLSNFSSF